MADKMFGPWTELENPCRGKDAKITFGAQSTHVLQVAGKPDAYIAMFDRWNKWDLQDSRHVWLPIEFDTQDKPTVPWHNSWSLKAKP
jgi:hypothetical protein